MRKETRRGGHRKFFCGLLAGLFLLQGAAQAASPTVSGDQLTAKRGETVTLAVTLTGNPGLAGWMFELTWDTESLSPVKSGADYAIKVGKPFAGGTLMANQTKEKSLLVSWFHIRNAVEDGTLFTVTFQLAKDIPTGSYPIEISCSAPNTMNEKENTVPLSTVAGSITVTEGGQSGGSTGTVDGNGGSSVEKPPQEALFSDVPKTHWAYTYINALAEKWIVSGLGDGSFGVNKNITRAEFVKMLAGVAGADVSSYQTTTFADVPTHAWYLPYVAWASENGIVNGQTATQFEPDAAVTREQAATLIWRLAAKLRVSLPEKQTALAFRDTKQISHYALDAVTAMQRAGILAGDTAGNFRPQGNATRAEAAKILAMFLQLKNI